MAQLSLLNRYAERLGLRDSAAQLHRRTEGTPAQLIDLLDELLQAHTQAICFENLEVVANLARGELRAVSLDLESVADKLLDSRRGGYCHEHAILIRAVLTDLGLSAHPILARVHLGEGRVAPGGLTHQATIVRVDGRNFLVDPGFGGGTPEVALELSTSSRARRTPRGEHRLVPAEAVLEPDIRAEAKWALQSRTSDDQEFRTVYAFADVPRPQADLDLANWFTSTKPGTPFTGPPVLVRSLPDGFKLTLDGHRLRRVSYSPDGDRCERTVTDAADFAEVLTAGFGLGMDRESSEIIWKSMPDD
ncbi:arylamine N-acetyltransferase [Brevibacterium sp. ZH18]|uniref:arylamine N-acetyltransferase family protein n=1 Tax=Brevibacterium sp. ZH18 TaxID=2927784 RepID=UPI001F60FF05|nr:arylamine N-acetyltransferase [Brevibacterium sp. ZH18]MCI4010801.1 arylamine N-acetyltransferase [Brevibacterium sp. ZH18]